MALNPQWVKYSLHCPMGEADYLHLPFKDIDLSTHLHLSVHNLLTVLMRGYGWKSDSLKMTSGSQLMIFISNVALRSKRTLLSLHSAFHIIDSKV